MDRLHLQRRASRRRDGDVRSGYTNLEPHLPATFTLICEIDAANRIHESNETNNTYTTEVSL